MPRKKPPVPVAPSPPALEAWDVTRTWTIRPGPHLGALLQSRTTPTLTPGMVLRRDLARYYLLVGADAALPEKDRKLLRRTAQFGLKLPKSETALFVAMIDAEEVRRAKTAAVPSVSPWREDADHGA